MNEIEELEWAVRSYVVVTEHFIEVLESHQDEVPSTIKDALMLLSNAINQEWDEESA